MKRVACLAGFGILLTGCYTLEPVGSTAPVPGAEVALDVNDAGRLALGGSMGPEISQVEGRLIEKDNTNYLVAVSLVRLLRGGEQTWKGEQVQIKSEYVTSVYERRFSAGRSIALGAIGVGIGAILAGRGIIGSGAADPATMPPDTAKSQRRPRP